MGDSHTWLWMITVAGGPILLGLAIAYGVTRYRRRPTGGRSPDYDRADG